MTITPTARGRIVMTELAGAYPAAVRSLPVRVHSEPGPFGPLMRREWGLPAGVPPDARHQVLSHLNGHLIAPVMHALSSGEADIATSRGAAEILAAAGWARLDADVPELTQDGEIATSLARQYRYPVMYLPLLRQVPELIFGEPAKTSDSGEETHLDRELDLRFSGDVFTAACREPFLGLALPLFEATPLDRQPALVVDAGCGDGALLEALYLAVRERTARGRRLAERPLLMAGVDPSPVARRMASARLAAAGVPHVIMDGDIGDPAGLERALAARGLDARDALHVCKSAIHDRAYEGAAPESPETPNRPASPRAADTQQGGVPPAGAGAYALPDGSAIPASSVAFDLAALFRRWLPVASRHGWLVIEAHAAPAAVLARLIGRTHATVLDATHGYACQYPVEPGVFAWAARAGGFVSRGHAEPGAATLGHTILTIDHFVAADQRARHGQVL
jgi:SAM-dependent methyltransferase